VGKDRFAQFAGEVGDQLPSLAQLVVATAGDADEEFNRSGTV
jgi:hypothetical protein